MNKKNRYWDFYLLYTIAFAGFALFLYSFFYLNGKAAIWGHDGVPQHVNSLAYYGNYLREILKSIFVEHQPALPMWDLHIGYGSDILTTLHYYVIGDPLTLLAVFVPEEKTEILYEILIFLRLYLAGLAFSGYCFSRRNAKQAVFLGTMIYVFCGWGIYASLKHPYFSNPMIYLPLILWGIDKIYKKEKPYLFIWATAAAAMSNFYFFYMICIFMFLYAAFCYFDLFLKRSFRDVCGWFFRFLGYFLVAVSVAAVILLPVAMTLFGTDRFSAENYVPLLYDRVYYEKYLGCLIGENMMQWGVAGFSAVAMAGVFVLFSQKKKNGLLKAGFLLLNLFLLVPFAGHVLNGFSYVSNRWLWAYSMLIAYIFVKIYPELFVLKRAEKKKIFCMLAVYCVLALFFRAARTERNTMAVLMLCLCVFACTSFGNIFFQGKYLCAAIAGILTASICLGIASQYSYDKGYLEEFVNRGEALQKLESGADTVVLATGDRDLYRYDQYGALPYDNTSMHMRTNSTAYYFSLANGDISRFFDEMYLNTPWEQHYENLDGRSILDRLASVRYFVIQDEDYPYIPYGYRVQSKVIQKGGHTYRAFQKEDALPFGYTYGSFISEDAFQKLSVTEKQEALLQGVVLEDSSLPAAELSFENQEVPVRIQELEGCQVKDGKILVTKEGARLRLNYDGLASSETYLIVENLNYQALSPRKLVSDAKWEKMSQYEKNRILYETRNWRYWKQSREASFSVTEKTVTKDIRVFTDKYNAYSGKKNFLCNMGYAEDAGQAMTLTFDRTGEYTFDDLRIVCQPTDRLDAYTEHLGEETLENIEFGINEFSGEIRLSRDKALVLSIPYSKGFTAYVDGEKTELKRANLMYMALELPAGEHRITLSYQTPGLKIGALLSALGLMAFAGIWLWEKKKSFLFCSRYTIIM